MLAERVCLLESVQPFLEKISTCNLETQDVDQLSILTEQLAKLKSLKGVTEKRIQQLSYVSMLSKANSRSNLIASKINGFIQKRKVLDEVNVEPSMKVSEWSEQYSKAMRIASVDDLKVSIILLDDFRH